MITLLWDKTTEPSPREKYLWCHAPGHDKEWCYWDGIRWIPAGSAPGRIDDDLLSDNIVRKSDLWELIPEIGIQQLYTWIKYADTPTGEGMSDHSQVDGVFKKYVGIAYNKITPEESDNPKDYEWSLFSGRDGVGIRSTSYWYIASENNFGVIAPPLYENPEIDGWSTDPSEFELDTTVRFLWCFTRIEYTDGSGWQSDPYIVKYFNEEAQITYDQVKDFVERKIVEDLDNSSSRLGAIDSITTKVTQKDGLTEFLNSYCSGEQASFADFVANSSKALINQNVGAAIWGEGSQQTLTSVGQSIDGINATLSTHATALFIDPEHPEEGTWINDVRQEMDAKTGTLTQAVSKAEYCWEWTGVDKTISEKSVETSVKTGEIFEYASTDNSCITKINDGESLTNYETRISALGKVDPSDPEEKGFERKVISESLSTVKQTADNISLIVGNKDGQLTGIIINAVTGDPSTIELIADKVVIDGELIANSIETYNVNITTQDPDYPDDPTKRLLVAHLGSDGLLANGATINGDITATSGKIGGFDVDNENLWTKGWEYISLSIKPVSYSDDDYNLITNGVIDKTAMYRLLRDFSFVSRYPTETFEERANIYMTENNLLEARSVIQWVENEEWDGCEVVNNSLYIEHLSGLSGKLDTSQYGLGPALWFGGDKIDAHVSDANNAARTLFRFDGSGYFANNNISWDRDGELHAKRMLLGDTIFADDEIKMEYSKGISKCWCTVAANGWVLDHYTYGSKGTNNVYFSIENVDPSYAAVYLYNKYTKKNETDEDCRVALRLDCTGAISNFAIMTMHGQFGGLKPATIEITTGAIDLGDGYYSYHNYIIPKSSTYSTITINFPDEDHCECGTEFLIMNNSAAKLNISSRGISVYDNNGIVPDGTISTGPKLIMIVFTSSTKAHLYKI